MYNEYMHNVPLHRKRKTMLRSNSNGPVVIRIEDRRYMVCDEKCYDVDGTQLSERCGALVDVTDMKQIVMATCSCGIPSNHRSAGGEEWGA